MKRFCLVVLALLLVHVAPASAEPPSWLNQGGADVYPQAGAVILQDTVSIQASEDGSYSVREHDVIRILTADGRQRFNKLSRLYDNSEASMEVHEAAVYLPDGEKHEVSADRILNEVPPDIQKNPLYGHVGVLNIDFGKVPLQGYIEFDITTHHKAARPLWETSFMQDTEPMLESTFVVAFPASVHMNYRGFGSLSKVAPVVREESGRHIWTWHVDHSPALVQEAGMPPVTDVTAKVMVSTSASWDDLAGQVARHWNEATEPGGATLTRYLARIKQKGNESRLAATFRTVMEETRPLQLDLAPCDWWPSHMPDLLTAKELSEVDRAALLIGLLKAQNIPAYPGFLGAADVSRVDWDFPTIQNFSTVVVVVPQDAGVVYAYPSEMVPELGMLPAPLQNRDILVLKGTELTWMSTPGSTSESNREMVVMEARVDGDGSMAEMVKFQQFGAMNSIWRDILASASSEDLSSLFEDLAQQIDKDSSLRNYYVLRDGNKELTNPLQMELNLDYNKAVSRDGDVLKLRLPLLPVRRLSNYLDHESHSPRVYPVSLYFPSHEDKKLHLVLPEGLRFKHLPSSVLKQNAVGEFQMVSHSKGRELWVVTRLVVRKFQLTPDEYPLLRELVQAAQHAEESAVVVEQSLHNTSRNDVILQGR